MGSAFGLLRAHVGWSGLEQSLAHTPALNPSAEGCRLLTHVTFPSLPFLVWEWGLKKQRAWPFPVCGRMCVCIFAIRGCSPVSEAGGVKAAALCALGRGDPLGTFWPPTSP